MSRQNTRLNKIARRAERFTRKRKTSARMRSAGFQPGLVAVTRRLIRQHLYRAIHGLPHSERVVSLARVIELPMVEVG